MVLSCWLGLNHDRDHRHGLVPAGRAVPAAGTKVVMLLFSAMGGVVVY